MFIPACLKKQASRIFQADQDVVKVQALKTSSFEANLRPLLCPLLPLCKMEGGTTPTLWGCEDSS